MTTDDDRYESIEIIVKARQEGESWFDVISDYITQDCEGGGGDCLVEDSDESDCDDHEHTELFPCTCGMESMGGTSGTLDQIYESKRINENWTTIKTEDLKLILRTVFPVVWETSKGQRTSPPEVRESYERLRKGAYWYQEFDEWLAANPNDEE